MLNRLLIVLAAALVATGAVADRLTIPGHYETSSISLPSRGSSMDQVLAEFGEPKIRKAAVGEPPITEWDYGNFRVYFEFHLVLHAVDLTTMVMPR
jgi:hypothetical protein